jgi:glycosyltransferase involved in cell wall biosynthesis
MSKPLVSICCITYNHAPYIAQAIEGFLMQETDFQVEIVIHDDASDDGTSEIVEQYAAEYSNLIRATINPSNKGMMANFVGCLADCRGEYIALCEGDDYWTENSKLSQQLALLQQHDHWSAVAHQVTYVDEEGKELPAPPTFNGSEVDLHYLFHHNLGHFIPTCSLFFRSRYWQHDIWQEELFFGDFTLHIVLALAGPIGFVQQNWGSYRRHKGGISYGMNWDAYLAGYPRFYKLVRKYLPGGKKHYLNRNLFQVYLNGANHFIANGDFRKGTSLILDCAKVFRLPFFYDFGRLVLKYGFFVLKEMFKKNKKLRY